MIVSPGDSNEIIVSIYCLVYNHEPFLRQCLDGFIMQNTDFRFEAIVHDDASTDKSAAIIKEYAEKYPMIIKPILENENQYSKKDGSLERIMLKNMRGKYIAICEGDDYWTDPYKLQKQVDLLKNDNSISMCCNKTARFSMKRNEIIGYISASEEDCMLSPQDVVLIGGGYIATCSMLIKASIFTDNYPDYCTECHVGDYPLQIMCAMKGRIAYLSDLMSVYRCENPLSWCGRFESDKLTDIKLMGLSSEIKMLSGFSSEYKDYQGLFEKKIRKIILKNVPQKDKYQDDYKKYSLYFKREIENFGLVFRLLYFVYASPLRKILRTCRKYLRKTKELSLRTSNPNWA